MATFSKKYIINVSATLLDQLSISFAQFTIGILFIYKSTPEEYGVYTFLMAFYYLIASMQNAIINTPLTIIKPRMHIDEANLLKQGLFGLLLGGMIFLLVLLVLCNIFLSSYFQSKGLKPSDIISFIFGLFSLMLRDFWRMEEFSNLRPNGALKLDILYTLILFVSVLFTISFTSINNRNIFIIIGISALFVTIFPSKEMLKNFPGYSELSFTFNKIFKFSSWALLGATTSWLQIQAFVYLPFFLIGVKEVAYLSAARLVMTPPALLLSSIGNYLRPLMSDRYNRGYQNRILNILLLTTLALIIVLFIYTGFALLLINKIAFYWIPSDYKNIGGYVILWSFIILLVTIRDIFTFIYYASLAFKQLALRSAVSSLFTISLTILFIFKVGINGSLFGRMAGEFFLLILLITGMHKICSTKLVG